MGKIFDQFVEFMCGWVASKNKWAQFAFGAVVIAAMIGFVALIFFLARQGNNPWSVIANE